MSKNIIYECSCKKWVNILGLKILPIKEQFIQMNLNIKVEICENYINFPQGIFRECEIDSEINEMRRIHSSV